MRKVVAMAAGSQTMYMSASSLAEEFHAAGFSSEQIGVVSHAQDALDTALQIGSDSNRYSEQQLLWVPCTL